MPKKDELEMFTPDETEKANQELLIDELIQVFNLDNIDKTSDSQKEELMQRVLKLGGDNYTFKGLRRDLLTIDDEDKKDKASQAFEDRIILVPEDESGLGRNWSTPNLDDNNNTGDQINLLEQILKELECEEMDVKDDMQSDSVVNVQENLEHLGILMNQDGIAIPKCGYQIIKRGGKSLKEL